MVTERQATAAVNKEFSGYNTAINCYCNNPDHYGCMRVPRAQELYYEAKEPTRGRRNRGKEKRHRSPFERRKRRKPR